MIYGKNRKFHIKVLKCLNVLSANLTIEKLGEQASKLLLYWTLILIQLCPLKDEGGYNPIHT